MNIRHIEVGLNLIILLKDDYWDFNKKTDRASLVNAWISRRKLRSWGTTGLYDMYMIGVL